MQLTLKEEFKIKEQIRSKRKKQKNIRDKYLTIVHTGDGKGKTTAAFGLVMRIIMHGWKALIVQFMKNPKEFQYAEHKWADQMENLDIFSMGAGFTWNTMNRDLDISTTLETWEKAKEFMSSGKYKLVVLDEINYVMDYKFLDEKEVVKFLKKKPPKLHLVLTGRNAPASIIQLADLVTEMKKIKHPYEEKGILAQKGVEW